ncbi:hypothetical protein BD410DRAFT_833183 [Rickenella mellea]|uniref:Protein kinase domain-containing protein n=1 Tax=Rickenella mellea TaxID=50990 RepID=A0A4Y7PFD6_9AGAM|nr:hypothetical protein BD410DRAFT_833183 [Rickenella mellea]
MSPTLAIIRRVKYDISEFPSCAPMDYESEPRIPSEKYTAHESDLPILRNVARLIHYNGPSWSRVYKALILMPDSDQLIPVAVKLYQEEFFPSEDEGAESPNELAWTESWAYSKMEDLQELTIVPKFYGAFEFSNENGGGILGIITELVRGVNLRDYCRGLGRERSWYDAIRQTASSIHKILLHGCAGLDIRAANVIVSHAEPAKITIIDFAFVRPLEGSPSVAKPSDTVRFGNMVEEIFQRQIGDSFGLIHKWLFIREMSNEYSGEEWVRSPMWVTLFDQNVKPVHIAKDEWEAAGVPGEYNDEEYKNYHRRAQKRNRM